MEREPDIEGAIGAAGQPPRAVDRVELAAIFAGGSLGALARAALAEATATGPAGWPWATFSVNLLAAGLLGWCITWLARSRPGAMRMRSLLATGLCGALSTFSTVMAEVVGMVDGSRWALAAGYTLASIAGGLLAVAFGIRLARGGLRAGPGGAP